MHQGEGAYGPRPSMAGLSSILRDRTAAAHRAAEKSIALDFGRPDASGYLAVLNGLLTFHTAVARFSRETVASELSQDMAALVRRRSLRTDIRLMSARVQTSSTRSAVRVCGHPPDRSGVANRLSGGREERIGAAYVAVGSLLGGRVIAASLAAGQCRDFPRSFFASDGLELGRLWRDFRIALDYFGESGADSARVITGALDAFAFFHDVFSGPGVVLAVAR